MSLTRCDQVARCQYDCRHYGCCSFDEEAVALMQRALPFLVKLGDFIGNGPIDHNRPDGRASLGSRCDLIGDIREFLDSRQ
jgi:hypothetical protein